jgi:CRISPR-associated protein (TIGR02584 family)
MTLLQKTSVTKRILLCVSGLSPQIVTETFYALAVTQKNKWVPNEIRLLTTTRGADNAKKMLLNEKNSWFSRLCDDWNLKKPKFDESCLDLLSDINGSALVDIRDDADNMIAADYIARRVKQLTSDNSTQLHASIAGGRKTMGFFLGNAMSLFARPGDQLSHVLVSSPFEGRSEFFYPSPVKRLLPSINKDEKRLDASKAQVWLGNIPFVRLRPVLPEHLLANDESFAQTIKQANMTLGDINLVIDIQNQTTFLNQVQVLLPPLQWGLLVLLAWRLNQSKPPLRAPFKGFDDPDWRKEVLHDLSACLGEMNIPDKLYQHLMTQGPVDSVFSQQLAKLEKTISKKYLSPWQRLVERVHQTGTNNRQRCYRLA